MRIQRLVQHLYLVCYFLLLLSLHGCSAIPDKPGLIADSSSVLTTPNSDWLEIPFLPGGVALPAKIRQPPIV